MGKEKEHKKASFSESELRKMKNDLSNVNDLFYIFVALLTVFQTLYNSNSVLLVFTTIVYVTPVLIFYIEDYSLLAKYWEKEKHFHFSKGKIFKLTIWFLFLLTFSVIVTLLLCIYTFKSYKLFYVLIRFETFYTLFMIIVRTLGMRTLIWR